ncbi:MAG: nucleotidyltransferase family protein [Pelovirga sp.]
MLDENGVEGFQSAIEHVAKAQAMAKKIRPSEALTPANCREVIRIVETRNCRNPRIFGSVLDGTDTPESDIDLLVEPLPKTSLFDIGGIMEDLKDLLGVEVDVATPPALPEKWRDEIETTAKPVKDWHKGTK